jgi:hypothetical protein
MSPFAGKATVERQTPGGHVPDTRHGPFGCIQSSGGFGYGSERLDGIEQELLA